MEHNEITRKVLSVDKNFFRNLHERYQFDFEGRIGFFRIDGNFTLNTVKKLVEENGFDKYAKCLIFTAFSSQVEKRGLMAFSPVSVKLYDNSFDTISVSGCNSYWRKSDFNDLRKYKDIVSYVIVQNAKDTKSRQKEREAQNKRKSREQERAEYKAYRLSRFRVFRVRHDSDEGWIREVMAYDEKGNECGIYHDFGWNDKHIDNLNEIIDGSGYVVSHYREFLKERLKAFKEMKANKAYAQTDNSDKVVTLNALASARKTILDVQFKSVKTSEEVNEFISKLYRFRSVMEDVERFCKRTEEKTFASIEDSEKSYKYILEQLTA